MSSYYPYQPVPAATPAYNPYSQYNAQQYTAQAASYASYFPPAYHPPPPPARVTPPPPDQPPPPPDLTSITPQVASKAIQRLIVSELRDSGFASAQPLAVECLERDVVAFIERLYERAHQYANLSNRSAAIATDLVLACEEFKIAPESLRPTRAKITRKKKKKAVPAAPTLIPARSRSPSPDRLPSDDESAPGPLTLRGLPTMFPKIPPKHTYLRTPASPPKKAAIPTLEKKLETAGLVQSSLKSLMVATEDAKGQEEGELLGHIVNSETGLHPRKRWKLSHTSSRKHKSSTASRVQTSLAS
ncbi:hypothetical protein MSAN_01426400 [Mycena sanguinolenta]|uniref:Transcription initiation factor TFIID subunit 8 n=1 Tax=Mycena sanguinolenta TaxID=230812 RepID=A0A8H7D1C2_9AGAR|nr:hypothetical protein MSAN_01426400 [Mycena sanguinolenta]